MAGGKLSPRMKMISLMYLVFIAMLALNMSKEVLSAFGLMNEKFQTENDTAKEINTNILESLRVKAEDNPAQYAHPKEVAEQVSEISNVLFDYIETLKTDIVEGVKRNEDGSLNYESMDKGDKVDEGWFRGGGYSEKGNEIIKKIEEYKEAMKGAVGSDPKTEFIIKEIDQFFDLSDVKAQDGATKLYLDYHFKGFPSIASLTKLSSMQNDVRSIEGEVFTSLIGSTATAAASMKNYKAFVISDKSAYFSGEKFKGSVVLARYDKSTVPTEVVINGSKIDLTKALQDGQVNLDFNVAGVGEHDISGKFVFMEDGKEVPIDVKGNYVVVNKPNSATIAADKMNVVYRGVTNPMTITFTGIPDNKVNASGEGLTKVSGSKYEMRPGNGKEVVISVSGKLDDGSTVSDKKTFRIKNIPNPSGTIRGEFAAKGSKSNLEISTVGAKLQDFDFDVKLNVTGFNIKIPGQPTIVVNGNKLDQRAKDAVKRASAGDIVVISEIKTKLEGASIMMPSTAPATFEIN